MHTKKIGAVVAAAAAALTFAACEPADTADTAEPLATSHTIETETAAVEETEASSFEYTPPAAPPASVRNQAYFDTLQAGGIRIGDDDALLVGMTVCSFFDEGHSAEDLFMEMAMDPYAENILPVVDNDDLPYAMGAAVAAFCPEHQGQFDF